MRTTVVEDLCVLAGVWDETVRRSTVSPFLRYGWFDAWWRAFGGGGMPHVVAAWRGEELAGLLPLWRDPNGVLRSMTNQHSPEFMIVADDEAAERALWREALRLHAPEIMVNVLDPARGVENLCRASRHRLRPVSAATATVSPFVDTSGSFTEFQCSLGRNLRKDLDRRRRRLHECGDVDIRFSDGSCALDHTLDEAFRVERTGWKGECGVAIEPGSTVERFYRDTAHWASALGILHVAELRLNGKLIAFEYSMRVSGAHYAIRAAFDAQHRGLAPGKLLLLEAIRDAFESECQTYDFLGGPDPYKFEWTSHARRLVRVRSFAPTPHGMSRYARSKLGGLRQRKNVTETETEQQLLPGQRVIHA